MSENYQCALISGASAGLGEEFARQLAGRVDRLILVARRRERLEALAKELSSQTEVLVIQADLSQATQRERLPEEIAAKGWSVDLLINNAGLGDYGEFSSSDWKANESMLRVNVEALTHMTHLFLPQMIAQEAGAIMNVSSLASTLPIPDFAVYAATKAYVSSFSEALRIELNDHGIEVLAVCPGPVKTEFGKVAARENDDGKRPGGQQMFYVSKSEVVSKALSALEAKKARVFPGTLVAGAALVISMLPMPALRWILSSRPRRRQLLEESK